MSSNIRERQSRGPAPVRRNPARAPIEREVELVTLLHGGGPVASEDDHPQHPTRKPDGATLLRGSAIRGQLRFFWRAVHGAALPSVAELRAQEDALFGNASKPGLVELTVDQGGLVASDVAVDSLERFVGVGLRYAAFASKNVTRVRGKAKIRLALGTSATEGQRTQVERALTAWLLFGGVGGRTRRGFGAVSAQGLPDPRQLVRQLPGRALIDEVPSLLGSTIVLSRAAFPSAEEAHKAAVDALRRFRQAPEVGRNSGQLANRPGRSRWPEPDEIRRLARQAAPQHAPVHPVRKFPRGAFGMPIVFHFMGHGEPSDGQLAPPPRGGRETGGRMASPIVLRPALVDGRWHAMAVRLVIPGGLPEKLLLRRQRGTELVRIDLTSVEAEQIKPLAALGANPDVIGAFLTFFGNL